MKVDNIVLNFSNKFSGQMIAPNGSVVIGENEIQPYNLLFGALGSCFYATFLEIVRKKRLTFSQAKIIVSGKKRKEVPTFLEVVEMDIEIEGADRPNQFLKCVELGGKYCSIYQTISKVADIKVNVNFI